MKFLLAALSLSFCLPAFATWSEDFAALKDIPRSYEDAGAICEEVARLDFKKDYPAPQYDVAVGIAYGDGQRTIGELDVIVFDNNTHKAVRVAEVKCWKNMSGGLNKALDQRARFLKNIRSGKKIVLESTSSHKVYDQEAFEYVEDFITVGQKGSLKEGYDQELNYTLKELHQYSVEMIRCQNQGQCARP
ncbi:hypothetical protein D3C87_103000 [compost metagenome]